MIFTIYGINYNTFKDLHDHFMPRTIITSSIWNNDEELYTIELTSKASLSASHETVRIFIGDKWYDLDKTDFHGVTII